MITQTQISETSYSEIEDTLSNPTMWLEKSIQEQFSDTVPNQATSDSEVTLYAVTKTPHGDQNVFRISSADTDDIYAWSEAPIFDLFNKISSLLDQLAKMRAVQSSLEDFEYESSEFWCQILELKSFLGVSDRFDEVISALLVLPANGSNSFLNDKRVEALDTALKLINHVVNLSLETVDAFFDILEGVEFDIHYVFGYGVEKE